MKIKVDDLSGSKIAELLRAHLQSLSALSPPESMHALNIDGLRRAEVTFWSAWEGEQLMGCGALKELDPQHAEIKSMRTAAAHLRKGVASAMLEHIISEAKRRKPAQGHLSSRHDDFMPSSGSNGVERLLGTWKIRIVSS